MSHYTLLTQQGFKKRELNKSRLIEVTMEIYFKAPILNNTGNLLHKIWTASVPTKTLLFYWLILTTLELG